MSHVSDDLYLHCINFPGAHVFQQECECFFTIAHACSIDVTIIYLCLAAILQDMSQVLQKADVCYFATTHVCTVTFFLSNTNT